MPITEEKSSILFIVLLMITPSATVKSGITSCQLMYLIEKDCISAPLRTLFVISALFEFLMHSCKTE